MDVSWAVHITMLAAVALTACQKGDGDSAKAAPAPVAEAKPSAMDAYAGDIGRLCDAMHLSGADQQPEGARQLAIAQWLGDALETQDARNFLVTLQSFDGAAKGQRLQEEATRLHLGDCALAASWQ
jgi:hypothetical protein